ncbi:MAG TPA: hypothetical protein VFR86_27765 [Burkholderiaceae bacterium]|nr:hypothetical protein [Burkholderiaceae bacterium]
MRAGDGHGLDSEPAGLSTSRQRCGYVRPSARCSRRFKRGEARYRYVGTHAPYEPAVAAMLRWFNTGAFWLGYAALVYLPGGFEGLQ